MEKPIAEEVTDNGKRNMDLTLLRLFLLCEITFLQKYIHTHDTYIHTYDEITIQWQKRFSRHNEINRECDLW